MDLRTELVHYFGLEKSWTIGLALFGLAALGLALFLWFARGPYRGAALPIGLFALLELSVGIGVAARTSDQVAGLLEQVERTSDMAEERLRMERIVRTFEIVKVAELVLLATGVALTYALRSSHFAFAVGVGLIAQCGALLVFDLIAERRAEPYLAALRALR